MPQRMELAPFRVDVPQAVLDDLHDRLVRTRLPNQIEGIGWDQGAELGYVGEADPLMHASRSP